MRSTTTPRHPLCAGRGAHDNGHRNTIVRGSTVLRQVTGEPWLRYYVHVARQVRMDQPLFVSVHGISRGADLHAHLFAPLVEAVGGILVAPLFDETRFGDYQRLGRMGRSDRADMALHRIIDDLSAALGSRFDKLVMFGYSGGGQFVHRYAMAHPRRVCRAVLAAPGWYTFPHPQATFPQGTDRTSRLPDLVFDPARFLKIPMLVLVGDQDIHQDAQLNKTRQIRTQQGANRLERARRWAAAMQAAADRFGIDTCYRFETLAGCGHSFTECMQSGRMGPRVIEFLFDETQSGHISVVGPARSPTPYPNA